METATKGYKLVRRIKDDRFTIERLHEYNLSLQVGIKSFRLSIVDTVKLRCLLLEEYRMPGADTTEEVLALIEQIYEEHHLLLAGFWKSVKVSFKSDRYNLIPSSLFSPNHLEELISLNTPYDAETDELFFHKHMNGNAVNVFAVEKILVDWFRARYPNPSLKIDVFHQSSALMEGILQYPEHEPGKNLFLFIDAFRMHIVVTNNYRLEFYNQFTIKKFEDFVRFTMMVMTEMGMDPKENKVILWGLIKPNSKHHEELGKYLKHLEFGKKPNYLKFGYQFDEAQEHQYFDIYNTYLCER